METALPTYDGLKCSRCLKNFKTLKILPCGHSICLECVVGYNDGGVKTFPCPVCEQKVKIPKNGVDGFITNSGLERLMDSLTTQPSTNLSHECSRKSQKGAEYYCLDCHLDLCSECCYILAHGNHTLLLLDSTRGIVDQDLSKFKNIISMMLEDLERTDAGLSKSSKMLKSFHDDSCTKFKARLKIIEEWKRNCEKMLKETQENFNMINFQLECTRKKYGERIAEIRAVEYTPSTEPTLSLVLSLKKLKDLQKLCENKIDIPQMTCVKWRGGSGIGNLSGIIGSIVIKPHYYPSPEGNVFQFNCRDIIKNERGSYYFSKDIYKWRGVEWRCYCRLSTSDSNKIYFFMGFQYKYIDHLVIKFIITFLNENKDQNIVKEFTYKLPEGIDEGKQLRFGELDFSESILYEMKLDALKDPSKGFNKEGIFLIKFDLLKVLGRKDKKHPSQI